MQQRDMLCILVVFLDSVYEVELVKQNVLLQF